MAKEARIASAEALVAYRRKLHDKARFIAAVSASVPAILYIIYIAIAYASINWPTPLPYFSLESDVLTIDDPQVLLRWLIFFLVLMAMVIIYLVVAHGLIKSYGRLVVRAHEEAVASELALDYRLKVTRLQTTTTAAEDDVVAQIGLQQAYRRDSFAFSTDLMSFDVSEYSYVKDNRQFNGLLAVTRLNQPRIKGFVQLRTYGEAPLNKYAGLNVRHLDETKESPAFAFSLYTSLSRIEAQAFVDDELLQKLARLNRLAPTDIVFTVADDTLALFIAAFRLELARPLSERLDPWLVHNQANTINTLTNSIVDLTKAASLSHTNIPLINTPLGEEAALIQTPTILI